MNKEVRKAAGHSKLDYVVDAIEGLNISGSEVVEIEKQVPIVNEVVKEVPVGKIVPSEKIEIRYVPVIEEVTKTIEVPVVTEVEVYVPTSDIKLISSKELYRELEARRLLGASIRHCERYGDDGRSACMSLRDYRNQILHNDNVFNEVYRNSAFYNSKSESEVDWEKLPSWFRELYGKI